MTLVNATRVGGGGLRERMFKIEGSLNPRLHHREANEQTTEPTVELLKGNDTFLKLFA